jgi:hypothetical protein
MRSEKGTHMNTSWMGPASEVPDDAGRRIRPGLRIRRVVKLPPEWAELALAAALPRLAAGNAPPTGGFSLTLPGGCLQLRPEAVTDDGYGTRQLLVGCLTSNRGSFRVPVELELAEWSDSKSELTLRPLEGLRRSRWGRWYLRTGGVFADLLAEALEVPVTSETYSGTSEQRLVA